MGGAPPEEVLISNNLSRTVSGENVSSQTYYNRGRGRGNYQNSRGSQSTYRGNSYESSSNNHSNSLPRSRGGSSRGRGQYESHGSLPRRGGIQEAEKSDGYYKGSYENNSYGSLPRRGGRQEGDRYYKGSSENRGNGRGRGRGYYQGNASSQEQIGSRDSVTRAPSQRRIDSMQRRRKMQIDKTKSFHEEETPRARSLPRNPVKRSLPDLMTNSFSSSQSVWSPNGKCPSFADILKRGSEEALEQIGKTEFEFDTKDTAQLGDEVMSTIETEETYHEEKSIENLTIISQSYASTRIPEGFGSVPCLSQEKIKEESVLRPPRKEKISSQTISKMSTVSTNSLSLFSDNDNVVVKELAILEPSNSQTVQIKKTEREEIKINRTEENENFRRSMDELTFIDKVNKPSSDDNTSISSQKTSRFGAIKSYANILSGGLRKVGNVFGRKNKEEQLNKKEKEPTDSKAKTDSSDSSKDYKENVEPISIIINQSPKTSATEKPEIPGLLFKTDLERRPSKKKRRSRPSSTFLEGRIESMENIDIEENKAKHVDSLISETSDRLKESNVVTTTEMFSERKSVVLQEDFEDVTQTENDKTNSMRRRNSKKKKKESTPSQKFIDEIDQALHEIKLMDTEEKNKAKENSNSLKRRPSKKSKKSSDHTDEQSKGELMKPSKDIDTGNMADDEEEKEKEKKKTSFKLDNTKFGAIGVQNENETVPVKITSSFSCESLVSKPDITNDATKSPAKLQLAQEI